MCCQDVDDRDKPGHDECKENGTLTSCRGLTAMGGAAPKLIYLVTEDWAFLTHRLPMAEAARAAGFDVAVATRVAKDAERIRALGFALYPLAWRRSALSAFAGVRDIWEIYRLYRRERPDVVHHVALKPMIYGGIAAMLARVPAIVSSLTGAGYLFAASSFKARLMRFPVTVVLRALLARRRSVVVVQNEELQAFVLRLAPRHADKVALIRGSGVDTAQLVSLPEPAARPVTLAYVGRLIADKGVRTLIDAHQAALRRGVAVRLLLAGTPDPENPTSIPAAEIEAWRRLPQVTLLGYVADVRQVWAAAHVAVLPSLHEGLPKSLLEAAACGRPIIASDIPGCRAVARANINALLFPAGDAAALADAIERLVRDDALRQRLAAASRGVVEPDLSAATVGAATVALYRRVLS